MRAGGGTRWLVAVALPAVIACGPTTPHPAPPPQRAERRHLIDPTPPRPDDRPHLIPVPPERHTSPTAAVAPADAAVRLVYLRLKLGERRVYVMPAEALHGTDGAIESFPVAIGRKGFETPVGRFQVAEKIVHPDFYLFDDWNDPTRVVRRFPPGADNPLGLRWIGFARARGWGIGFHGTPNPELLGRAVSHGCVRMRNEDVVRLFDRVAIGTTVVVEP